MRKVLHDQAKTSACITTKHLAKLVLETPGVVNAGFRFETCSSVNIE
jgi:hypothetical protein